MSKHSNRVRFLIDKILKEIETEPKNGNSSITIIEIKHKDGGYVDIKQKTSKKIL